LDKSLIPQLSFDAANTSKPAMIIVITPLRAFRGGEGEEGERGNILEREEQDDGAQ
jgi:hypothetical protein